MTAVQRRNHRSGRRGRRSRLLRRHGRFFSRRWRECSIFLRAVQGAPPVVRVTVGALLAVMVWLTANWLYHAANKPTELFFPVEDNLDKSPRDTWRLYGSLFKKHSTAVISPELLAALAQVEGAGNPVARTYWRWQLSWNPFEVYRPASSAVGMFQITDGTFQEARRLCIHDHTVVSDGPWHDMNSCWFNSLYTRVLPGHAIEMTAALLDRQVSQTVGGRQATLHQKQELAAVIHLCGAGAGRAFVMRRFRLVAGQRCGDHEAKAYLAKVNAMKREFVRLLTDDRTISQER